MEEKNIVHKSKKSNMYLSSKLMFFKISKYVLMIATTLFLYLIIRNTVFIKDNNHLLDVGWNWLFFALLAWTSYKVAQLILGTINISWLAAFYTMLFIGFSNLIIFLEINRKISDVDEYIRVIYYALVPIILGLITTIINIHANRRVSPLVAKNNIIKLVSQIFISLSLVLGYLLIWFLYIKEDHEFNIANLAESLIISFLPFTLLIGIISRFYWMYKNKKIKFRAWNKDLIRIVFIPIYIAISIWFVEKTFVWSGSLQSIIYALVSSWVLFTSILYVVFIKNELASSNISNIFFGIMLLIIWIMPIVYMLLFGYLENIYTLINISAITTIGLFVLMALKDTSMSKSQSYAFASLVVTLAGVLFGFWLYEEFVQEIENLDLPFDFDTFLLLMFASVPTSFLTTCIFKVWWRQRVLSKNIQMEIKLNKKIIKMEKEVINA